MTNHQRENETLRRIVRDLHWMARRYAARQGGEE